MWAWFTTESVWILFGASVALLLILFFRDRIRDGMASLISEKSREGTISILLL